MQWRLRTGWEEWSRGAEHTPLCGPVSIQVLWPNRKTQGNLDLGKTACPGIQRSPTASIAKTQESTTLEQQTASVAMTSRLEMVTMTTGMTPGWSSWPKRGTQERPLQPWQGSPPPILLANDMGGVCCLNTSNTQSHNCYDCDLWTGLSLEIIKWTAKIDKRQLNLHQALS